MKIVKSILCAIGLTYLTNISLVSIFPLILLVVFLALHSKIEIIKEYKKNRSGFFWAYIIARSQYR